MSEIFSNTSPIEIEQKLCQVQGVKAARVVVNDCNDIEEIHLIALPSRNPTQLVREVESKLLDEYSLPINRNKVTIAEFNGDRQQKVTEPRENKVRLKLIDVQVTRSNVNASAMVMLQVNDLSLCGEASGPATKHNALRLIAEACISALKRVIRRSYAFAIEGLRVIEINDDQIIVIKLAQVGESGEQHLVGTAIVDKDLETAVAKSVLDAVNRQLHDLRVV